MALDDAIELALIFHTSPLPRPLTEYPPRVLQELRRRADAILIRSHRSEMPGG